MTCDRGAVREGAAMPRLLVVFAVGACVVACYTVPPAERFGEPTTDVPSAKVVNQAGLGSMTICGVPGSQRACRAWLYAVDGKQAGYFSLNTRIPAGHHEVVLACETWSGGGVLAGALQMTYVSYNGPFAANRTYYVRCEKRHEAVVAWIADSKHGGGSRAFGAVAGGGGDTAIPLQPLPPLPDDLSTLQSAHRDPTVNPSPGSAHSPPR
jgi:hypothetical protein